MDDLDQRWELIGRYLVPSHIRGDNFRREFPIGRAGRLLVRHRLALPFRVSRNIPYPKVSRRRLDRHNYDANTIFASRGLYQPQAYYQALGCAACSATQRLAAGPVSASVRGPLCMPPGSRLLAV